MDNHKSDQPAERLQKVLAKAGVASRRGAEELILAGKVTVNGKLVTELGTKVTQKDIVRVGGNIVGKREPLHYYIFNKPVGVITSSKDPQRRQTVLDFFKNVPVRVYPVGRLDFDTSGLLLLTNDGELANRLTHPSFGVNKTYVATVKGRITSDAIENLRSGVELEDGKTAPARVSLIKPGRDGLSRLEMTIHEGRNRQVRRMCDAVGFPVVKLERMRFGPLSLGDLKPGAYRPLRAQEIKSLKVEAGLNNERD